MRTEQVEQYMQNIPAGIIAIDGELGAGKTIFSQQLGGQYGIRVIHIDDYLNPGKGRYVSALRINELERSIRNGGLPVVVEGICLLTVLSRMGMTPSLHFFLYRAENSNYKEGSRIVSEVRKYIKETDAPGKATEVITMTNSSTNQLDVDIAYIKSKTIVSVILAVGGIVALLVGAYILSSGIGGKDSAVFEILGAKITAEGIGAVILASSVFWAYFAYLAKPKYSRRREVKSSTSPDGTRSQYEFESSTMISAEASQNDKDL